MAKNPNNTQVSGGDLRKAPCFEQPRLHGCLGAPRGRPLGGPLVSRVRCLGAVRCTFSGDFGFMQQGTQGVDGNPESAAGKPIHVCEVDANDFAL